MVTLWATLGLGVSAGLMVISHAATLLYSHGASIGAATAGVSVVSMCTSPGRVAGGYACDREKGGPAKVLRLAPLVAAPALLWASLAAQSVPAAQCALAFASLTYGALGTAVPTEVRRRVGAGNARARPGEVYTAWGVAGLAAPARRRRAVRRRRELRRRARRGDGPAPALRARRGRASAGAARGVGGDDRAQTDASA